MLKAFIKRHFWTIIITLFVVEIAILTAVRHWEDLFPSRTAHLVYNHYASNSSIKATYLKDYKINDTLYADIAVLQATDDTSWHTLENDFNITPLPDEVIGLIDITHPIINIQELPSYNDSCILSVVYAEKTLHIIATGDKNTTHAIIHKLFDNSLKTKTEPNAADRCGGSALRRKLI